MSPIIQNAGHKPLAVLGILMLASILPYLKLFFPLEFTRPEMILLPLRSAVRINTDLPSSLPTDTCASSYACSSWFVHPASCTSFVHTLALKESNSSLKTVFSCCSLGFKSISFDEQDCCMEHTDNNNKAVTFFIIIVF